MPRSQRARNVGESYYGAGAPPPQTARTSAPGGAPFPDQAGRATAPPPQTGQSEWYDARSYGQRVYNHNQGPFYSRPSAGGGYYPQDRFFRQQAQVRGRNRGCGNFNAGSALGSFMGLGLMILGGMALVPELAALGAVVLILSLLSGASRNSQPQQEVGEYNR